jgi:hypothetical protein
MEMLGIAEKNLLDNKVEVMTYFVNDENIKNWEWKCERGH